MHRSERQREIFVMRAGYSRFIMAGLFLAGAIAAQADRYVVEPGTPGGTDTGLFDDWTCAATQIQWAVDAAENDETVWISNGDYVLTNPVTVDRNISLVGTGGVAVVDGDGQYRCFYFSQTATGALENLFITRGYCDGEGGGVWMSNGLVQKCTFSNNTATSHGGGLSTYGVVRECTFVANTSVSGYGGGLSQGGRDSALVDGSLFYTNRANNGGGMRINGTCLVTNCDLISNVATGNDAVGGGLYSTGVKLRNCRVVSNVAEDSTSDGGGVYGGGSFYDCLFSYNKAGHLGGGVRTEGGTFSNCVFVGNETFTLVGDYGGSAIYAIGATLLNCTMKENASVSGSAVLLRNGGTMRNCLVFNNTGWRDGGLGVWRNSTKEISISGCTIVSNRGTHICGGGVYVQAQTQPIALNNNIIYFNECDGNPAGSNVYVHADATASFSNCCFAPALADVAATNYSSDNITEDPRFKNAAAGDYRLRYSSPCIDAGLYEPWMEAALDLDGGPRIRYDTVDMGAYEVLKIMGGIISVH